MPSLYFEIFEQFSNISSGKFLWNFLQHFLYEDHFMNITQTEVCCWEMYLIFTRLDNCTLNAFDPYSEQYKYSSNIYLLTSQPTNNRILTERERERQTSSRNTFSQVPWSVEKSPLNVYFSVITKELVGCIKPNIFLENMLWWLTKSGIYVYGSVNEIINKLWVCRNC